MKNPLVIDGAEPFFIPAGKTGILLVHGLTGTPKEMRKMGAHLAQQGFTVLAIRLNGHATSPDDLARMTWSDWLAAVEDGLSLLRCVTDEIFIMGLSLGGVLSLISAARYPVSGVVAMSTPYELPKDWRLNFVKILSYLHIHVDKGTPDWHDSENSIGHIDYPYYQAKAIYELNDLLKELHLSLPLIQVPALLIHSKNDRGVSLENMSKIYQHLKTPDKQILLVENSGHNIVCDSDREIVFDAAAQFAKKFSKI